MYKKKTSQQWKNTKHNTTFRKIFVNRMKKDEKRTIDHTSNLLQKGSSQYSYLLSQNSDRNSPAKCPQSIASFQSKTRSINPKEIILQNSQKKMQPNNTTSNKLYSFINNKQVAYNSLQNKQPLVEQRSKSEIVKQPRSFSEHKFDISINNLQNKIQNSIHDKIVRLRNHQRMYTDLDHHSKSRNRSQMKSLPIEIEQKSQKSYINFNKLNQYAEEASKTDLSHLLRDIKNLRTKTQNDDEQIQFSSKKIDMIERLLAESNTESQIAKEMFFSSLAQKKSHRKGLLQSKTSKLIFPENSKSPQSVDLITSNRSTFKLPKPEDYEQYRYKQPSYIPNGQPIPRSSYNRQFLFPGMNKRVAPCINSGSKLSYGQQMREKSSTYHKDFQQRKGQRFDYKQLDCWRDKIKNLEISYTKLKNLNAANIQRNNFTPKVEHLKTQQTKKAAYVPFINIMSESKRQFKGMRGLSSVIKNKHLENLKYSYKSMTK